MAAKVASKKSPEKAQDVNTQDFNTRFEKRIKISSKSLKKLFNANDPPDAKSPIGKLQQRVQSLIKDGRMYNFREYKTWAAIDAAYNVAFNQTTPTLINSILNRRMTADQTLEAVKAWGISEDQLFTEVEEVTTAGPVKRKYLNRQTFYNIFIPLVKSYTTARTAKLFNDRNQYPFLKYEPVKFIEVNRMRCEVITDLVQTITHHYGLESTLREAILHAILYSVALVFPQEVWHCEEQTDDEGKDYTVREGMRYTVPHPSRMFYDLSKPMSGFNTDTGGDYAGYWRVLKWGEVERNGKYWNKEKISYGTNWFDPTISGTYFSELYPCQTKLFEISNGAELGWNANDTASREKMMALYTVSDNDKPVFVTDLFLRLKPCEWGLGEYRHNVWFRFVIASDQTVIWAEPMPYSPVLFIGYDIHESQSRNPSFALEVLPWQDHLGNIFTQILLSVKQNAAKFVAYDEQQVDPKDVKELRTQQKDASGILYFKFNSRKSKVEQVDPTRMFIPVQFPQQNVAEMTGTINTVISIMERLLGMSSQELGASANHIQTAEEVKTIAGSTSTRVDYTGSFVDQFMDAWKRQLFYAAKTYSDPDFESHVSGYTEESLTQLKDLGFEVVGQHENRAHVKGKWELLDYEAMVSSREGMNRINQPAIAQVMMQTLAQAGPLMAQNGATKQLVALLDRAAQMAGCPKDFRITIPEPKPQQPDPLRNLSEKLNFKDLPDDVKMQFLQILGFKVDPSQAPAAQAQQMQAALAQISQQIQSGAVETVAKTLQPLAAEVQTQQKNEQTLQQQVEKLTQLIESKLGPIGAVAAGAPSAPDPRALDRAAS